VALGSSGRLGSAAGQPDDLPFDVAFDELRQVLVEPLLQQRTQEFADDVLDELKNAQRRLAIGAYPVFKI